MLIFLVEMDPTALLSSYQNINLQKYDFIFRYGGPGTQKVTEQFHLGYHTYLSGAENVIYVSIDGRGSGARGDRFLHEVYRNLGTVEVQDQINAAK